MTELSNYQAVLDGLRKRTGVNSGPLSLVSFTIAGVQEFLDAARTTRDVWNGSYLLSYLVWRATRVALSEIEQDNRISKQDTSRFVLLPAVEAQPFWRWWAHGSAEGLDVAHFPNTVLLVVPGDAHAAAGLANAMELAIEQEWAKICNAAREPLATLLNDNTAGWFWDHQTRWRRSHRGQSWQQVFEVYSSVFTLPDDEDSFEKLAGGLRLDPERGPAGQLFEAAMRLLTDRKARRDFEQWVQEGYRCSLCGSRSALANYARNATTGALRISAEAVGEFWEQVRDIQTLKYTFREGDRLCAVCTVRRLAPQSYLRGVFPEIRERILFPSTSAIATADWASEVLRKAEEDEHVYAAAAAFPDTLRAWQRELGIEDPPEAMLPYFDSAPQGLQAFAQIDGRWFYEETYAPDQLMRDFGIAETLARSHASPFPEFIRKLREQGLRDPDDYIAVLAADGDRMGEWMSGRMAPERFDLDWQAKLSAALAEFAREVCNRLEKDLPAKVVYAGGDDVLAFVPQRRLLEAIDALDSAFEEKVRQPLGFCRSAPIAPTLSVAAVLAKHNEPLRGAIVRAHQLLKNTAKRAFGRNAFAIYRTTEGIETGAGFSVDGQRTLAPLAALFQAMCGKLSPRVRYELERLRDGFAPWFDEGARREALQAVIRRAFERHYDAPADSAETQQVLEAATQLFELVWRWSQIKHGEPIEPLAAFLGLLGLVQFLARHKS